MDRKKKLVPILKNILKTPIYLFALLVFMNIYMYVFDIKAGIVTSIFLLIYAAASVIIYLIRRKRLVGELVSFAVGYGTIQRRLSSELELPYALVDAEGSILWADSNFVKMVGNKVKTRQSVTDFFPQLDPEVFPEKDGADKEILLDHNDSNYRVLLKDVAVDGLEGDSFWSSEKHVPAGKSSGRLIALYFYDETQINSLKRELSDRETVVGLVYIDNYDEALESVQEERKSFFAAMLDRRINKYFLNYEALIRQLEKDKYILVLQNRYLEELKSAKFPILDELRSVNIGNEISATLSIGIGAHANDLNRGYEEARAAIDLALGRGGDQVVIRGGDAIEYYGGKSSSVEKNTRVKSRVKAQALREIIETKDRILIMGHSNGDADSFGAAVGVYRIAASLNKEAHIVLGESTSAIDVMVDRFRGNPEYPGMIVTPAEALEMCDNMTLVVVVDVNRPSHTECPDLIGKARAVVVLDHHRQSSEAIDNAALSYIEPSASSASEIISEIIQYIGTGVKLKQLDSDAMFAGIMIDSNNFQAKTGIRTFEAAAFLRRNGADIIRIRKAFRADMNEYMAKARGIASAEVFMDCYAFAECDAKGLESPTVIGAQIANELMDVSNIKASFVFTEYNDIIYVSARSIDELNVQVVMEKLGGGGHMSVAGTQFNDCDVNEAMERVKEVLRRMKEGGEI
ncbi:MAG: DHH family phosphoesterase [Lachnospiraceae bacterium]|nr:DHH family phosphoesterase [Lachnospiraceae bacterium]